VARKRELLDEARAHVAGADEGDLHDELLVDVECFDKA
jgi:hypothetical protein